MKDMSNEELAQEVWNIMVAEELECSDAKTVYAELLRRLAEGERAISAIVHKDIRAMADIAEQYKEGR